MHRIMPHAIAAIRNSAKTILRRCQCRPKPASRRRRIWRNWRIGPHAWITDLAAGSRGRFAICLSGGSTPRRLYQLLAGAPYREAMPWDRVHWFWGDERFVPWDHPDSNYRMAREAMLAHVPVPAQNIHGIATSR